MSSQMHFKLKSLHILTITIVIGFCSPKWIPAQQQEEERFKIQWHDHTFYTNKPRPAMLRALTIETYPDTINGYYFVQFTGPITKEMKAQVVEAGGELFNYIPNNTYIVKMTSGERTRVETLPVVQWIGVYQPAMKLSQKLIRRVERIAIDTVKAPTKPPFRHIIPPISIKGDTLAAPPDTTKPRDPGPLHLTIVVFKGENIVAIQRSIIQAGGTVRQTNEGKHRSTLIINIPRENIYNLAKINGIIRIEERIIHKIYNDKSREIMKVNPVWGASGLVLKGNGQIIGISDTGLDSGNDATIHDDFAGRIINIYSWPVEDVSVNFGGGDVRLPSNVGADDGAADVESGHGTHVAGSVLGNGILSAGVFSGAAPEASLVFQAIEQYTNFVGTDRDGYYLTGIPIDIQDLFQATYDAGARIHTNSWGADAGGEYTNNSFAVDEFVWEHPDMLILFAAGNAGADSDNDDIIDPSSVGSPGTAKNCLTVGASENNRPDIEFTYEFFFGPEFGTVRNEDLMADNPGGLAAFSSRGPIVDGRIKPDVVAPGTFIASTRTQETPNTMYRGDNMEGGSGLWTAGAPWAQVATDAHSGTTSWHDSPGGNYSVGVDALLAWNSIDLTPGDEYKLLSFWFKTQLGTGDIFQLEIFFPSLGGGIPIDLTDIFGSSISSWQYVLLDLSPLYDHPDLTLADLANVVFQFRLLGNSDGSTGDGAFLDDVMVFDAKTTGWGLLSEHGLTNPGSVVDQHYMFMGGTSMATPLTAGAAAIVRQYYTDVVGLDYMSAALLRATMMNGAIDLSPGQYTADGITETDPKPDNDQGWGRIDLENSLFPASPVMIDHRDELTGLEDLDTHSYTLRIIDDSVPISVTMVYHDYPGSGLQNNLDLSITDPDGFTTFYPNKLGGPDPTNNVEQIVIPILQVKEDDYTITVNGTDIQHGPQPYALVTSGGGTIVDRQPVDVMLVLDLSGSMLSNACPTGCDSKLQVLKDAVEIFVAVWRAVVESDDRIGVTYFRTNISKLDVGDGVLMPVVSNAAAIVTDVQSQITIPTNLTAMGGGLQSALNTLVDNTRPRKIILFTDGMQNVNPIVQVSDLDIEAEPGRTDSNIDPEDPPTRLNTDLEIKVNTIGVGATPPFVNLLDDIASATGGLSKLTTAPDDDLRRFYVEELIDVLRDFSPQLLAYRYGNLTTTTSTETFTVNNGARKIILKLSWKRADSLSFQVEKDGIDLTRFGQIIDGPFYRIFSMDLPAEVHGTPINAGGDWKMHISGKSGVPYEAAAIVDEPLLEYDFSLGSNDYVVGDPLELNVRVTIGRRPVTDASRVVATLLKPRQGLGTLLSINPTPAEPPGFRLESAATAGQKKLQLLSLDESFYSDLQPVGQTLVLQNNRDGSYSTTFSNTNMTGTYTVNFHIEGEHSDIGKYERTEILSTTVRFAKAEFNVSDLRVSLLEKTADGRRMLLHIRPKDRFGNYLGPDYGHRIKVSLSDVSVDVDKSDLVNGGYTIPLFIPLTTDPVLTVTVMDETVFKDRLSKIHKESNFAISIHAGTTLPLSDFDNSFDPGLLTEVDLEYSFSKQLSLEAVLGRYAFDPDYEITGGTLYLKGYLPLNGWRLFGALGPGFYKPENINAAFGVSLGVGLNKSLSQQLHADIGAYYFRIFPDGDDIDFIGIKTGLRYSF